MIAAARPMAASICGSENQPPLMSNQLTAARLVSTSANSRQNTPSVSSSVLGPAVAGARIGQVRAMVRFIQPELAAQPERIGGRHERAASPGLRYQ